MSGLGADSLGYFELMAECSVALGGFAAVHAVLRGSTGPRGTYRAWGSVTYGFTALLMSLAPLLVAAGADLDRAGWRAASALGLLPCVACQVASLVWNRRLNRAGHRPQARAVFGTNMTVLSLAILALLANVVGWPWSPGWGAYASATTLVLFSGVLAISISFWLAMSHSLQEGSAEP
jgi:hypothetical protein